MSALRETPTGHPWKAKYPLNVDWQLEIPVRPVYALLDDAVTRFADAGAIKQRLGLTLRVREACRGCRRYLITRSGPERHGAQRNACAPASATGSEGAIWPTIG